MLLSSVGYSQQISTVVTSSSRTTSANGVVSTTTGSVPSTAALAPGLVLNAPLIDWGAAMVRRRETFTFDGIPIVWFIARNGGCFGLRHKDQVMASITALMKPGEQLSWDSCDRYCITVETMVSVLKSGPAANPGITSITSEAPQQLVITHRDGVPVPTAPPTPQPLQAQPTTGSPVPGEPTGVHAVPMPHDVLGQVILFYSENDHDRPLGGERFRHLCEAAAGGKPLQRITRGQATGAWYATP